MRKLIEVVVEGAVEGELVHAHAREVVEEVTEDEEARYSRRGGSR